MWCLRGYYFKMVPGTAKKAIACGKFVLDWSIPSMIKERNFFGHNSVSRQFP